MRQLGILAVGLCGRAASTAAATIELLRRNRSDRSALPIGSHDHLANYRGIQFAGWDLDPSTCFSAAQRQGAVAERDLGPIEAAMDAIKALPALGHDGFCGANRGSNRREELTLREKIECLQDDMDALTARTGGRAVVLNLASPENAPAVRPAVLNRRSALEDALDDQSEEISPAVLYAYAAIDAGLPYAQFSPSHVSEAPAIFDLARERGVPICGRGHDSHANLRDSSDAAPLIIELSRCLDLALRQGEAGPVSSFNAAFDASEGALPWDDLGARDPIAPLRLWLANQEAMPRERTRGRAHQPELGMAMPQTAV
ncbi:hypothetical protein HK107_13735 [Parvularcula sp. ZS-1/3]|uniref:Myo-inositol-1-phosphate synthase n=1 Tax=Parvularcula mediterranea TaxID=2732508 RepID=A0A7Y3RNN7_9PROT|nr:inositol-3-phosphate synthase [Parvularcula mediterranea]NNU17388.1 hypothetical protein [Parvularcula mediterranea]